MTNDRERNDTQGLVKIFFDLEKSDHHNSATESVWAEPVGKGEFKIDNIPIYIYGVSAEDVVRAGLRDGVLIFDGVARRGGHSTYRIFVMMGERTEQPFLGFWQRLETLGCSCEGDARRLIAVDVPPAADIHAAYGVLEAGVAAGVWDFEEGHMGHPLHSR